MSQELNSMTIVQLKDLYNSISEGKTVKAKIKKDDLITEILTIQKANTKPKKVKEKVVLKVKKIVNSVIKSAKEKEEVQSEGNPDTHEIDFDVENIEKPNTTHLSRFTIELLLGDANKAKLISIAKAERIDINEKVTKDLILKEITEYFINLGNLLNKNAKSHVLVSEKDIKSDKNADIESELARSPLDQMLFEFEQGFKNVKESISSIVSTHNKGELIKACEDKNVRYNIKDSRQSLALKLLKTN